MKTGPTDHGEGQGSRVGGSDLTYVLTLVGLPTTLAQTLADTVETVRREGWSHPERLPADPPTYCGVIEVQRVYGWWITRCSCGQGALNRLLSVALAVIDHDPTGLEPS